MSGYATRGASFPCKSRKLFIFSMLRNNNALPVFHILGKTSREAEKKRSSGYPHLWKTLWITPKSLWERTERSVVLMELGISIIYAVG